MLIGVVIAMVVAALLFPSVIMLLRRSAELAALPADNDEGIAARAELAEMFAAVDPISECASPEAGQDAAYRDRCFRERRWAGASLIKAPALPATRLDPANPETEQAACWLTSQEGGPRQRKCIVLEGDADELQCSDAPSGPCLRVLSESDETDGEPVLVDLHGGGLLLVRSWDEDTTGGGVPFLPHEWDDQPADRLIYTDVEWWCMRWRSPAPDGAGGVSDWEGRCPSPADPCERTLPEGTAWNFQTAITKQGIISQCVASVPDPPAAAAYVDANDDAVDPDANDDGLIDGPPRIRDRITDVELLVCVASEYAERLQGAPHCKVDRMRFNIADSHGWMPPVLGLALDGSVVADGLTVTEGSAGTSFEVRLAVQPTADVEVTASVVGSPTGVTLAPTTPLTFTPTNWDRTQMITVTSAHDADRDDETATVNLAATGGGYDGLTAQVQVTVIDDDP